MEAQQFLVTPPTMGTLAWLVLIGVAILIPVTLFGYLLIGIYSSRVEINNNKVKFVAPFYGQSVRRSDINLDTIAVLSSEQTSELLTAKRKNGIGIGSLRLGKFQLEDGELLTLYNTGGNGIVYFSTKSGRHFAVTVVKPNELVSAIQQGKD